MNVISDQMTTILTSPAPKEAQVQNNIKQYGLVFTVSLTHKRPLHGNLWIQGFKYFILLLTRFTQLPGEVTWSTLLKPHEEVNMNIRSPPMESCSLEKGMTQDFVYIWEFE